MIKNSIISSFFLVLLLFAFVLGSQEPAKRLEAKLSFSNGSGWKLGTTAPRVWSELERLSYPNPNQFRLTFPGTKPGFYKGPDSGEVYLWSKGLYKWTQKSGAIYSEWESGQWQLTLPDQLVVNFYPEKNRFGKFYIVYPDGTSLQKNWIEHRADFEYIYQKLAGEASESFTIPNPAQFGSNRAELGRLDFFFPDSWKFYVEAFQRDFLSSNFYTVLKSDYNLEAPGEVPLLFFEKREDISKYVGRNLINNSQEGGFGGRDAVMLCCGDSKPQKTGNLAIDKDQEKRMFFGTFYHELVHNTAQLHCFKTNASKSPLPEEKVEDWFVEGFANLVASDFEPSKRAFLWEFTKALFDEKKIPKSYDAMVQAKYKDMVPYSLGAYFGFYLQETYGKKILTDYLTRTCGGTLGKDALIAGTGKSAESIYQAAIREFPSRYKAIEPQLRKWKTEGFFVIQAINPNQLIESLDFLIPPEEGKDYSYDEVPDFYNAFLANVGEFSGKTEGDFATETDLSFYLWKKGNYRWYNDEMEADFFEGDQVFLRFKKGGSFTVWKDGKKRITYPSGASLFYWDSNQKAFFDKNGKEIR